MGRWTKGPSEGGSGGKRGHSRMEHWQPTAEVKANANQRRRRDDSITTVIQGGHYTVFLDIPTTTGSTTCL